MTHTEGEELAISPVHLIEVTIHPCDMDDVHMPLDGRSNKAVDLMIHKAGNHIHFDPLEVCSPLHSLLLCNSLHLYSA